MQIQRKSSIAENILSSLHKGVRQINKDLDIVEVQSNSFHYSSLLINNKGETAEKVSVISPFLEQLAKKGLPNLSLMPDILSTDRIMQKHKVAKITTVNNQSFYVIDPLELLMHKMADTLTCSKIMNNPDKKDTVRESAALKYQKDLSDLSCIFNAVAKLYADISFEQELKETLTNNADSKICKLEQLNFQPNIKQIFNDANTLIEDSHKNAFGEFICSFLKLNLDKLEKGVEPSA